MADKRRPPGHITPPPEFHDSMNRGEWQQAATYVRSLECELRLLREFLRYSEWRSATMPPDMQRAIKACRLGQEWEQLC